MIGRFTKQGTYRELFDIHDILRVVFGGLLALLGFVGKRQWFCVCLQHHFDTFISGGERYSDYLVSRIRYSAKKGQC